MIETDAPFLIPKNFDKKPKSNKNEPKYLPHILKTIAHYKNDYDFKLKHITYEEIEERINHQGEMFSDE